MPPERAVRTLPPPPAAQFDVSPRVHRTPRVGTQLRPERQHGRSPGITGSAASGTGSC